MDDKNFLISENFTYILNKSDANNAASSPPVPALISMIAFFSSDSSLGISKNFIGSDIVYGNQAKSILLNDNDIDFENWEELCVNLTHSSLEKYKSDICLTILGEAGPLSSSQYSVGTIFICISNGDKTVITDHKMNGNREEILQRSANKAQWELIKFIKNLY